MNQEECLICGAPLEYHEQDTLMECAICHKKENSKTRCVNGHYVCSECHSAGMDTIVALVSEDLEYFRKHAMAPSHRDKKTPEPDADPATQGETPAEA